MHRQCFHVAVHVLVLHLDEPVRQLLHPGQLTYMDQLKKVLLCAVDNFLDRQCLPDADQMVAQQIRDGQNLGADQTFLDAAHLVCL